MHSATLLASVLVPVASLSSLLVPNVRVPAAPLMVTSPFLSVWSAADELYAANTSHWSGAASNLAGLVSVDGTVYGWMGDAEAIGVRPVQQLGPPSVAATQTLYSFTISTTVMLNVTFTTPLIPPNGTYPYSAQPPSGPDYFTLPVTYVTWSVYSLDGDSHAVSLYLDVDATLVTNNSYAYSTPVTWDRVLPTSPDLHALRLGAASQWPLNPVVCGQSQPLTASQTIVWGWLYGLCSTCNASRAGSTWASRAAFMSNSALPPDDPNTSPVAVGEGFPGLAYVWSSTVAAPTGGYLTLFMDEILSHNYTFDGLSPAVIMPPLWRVNLPFNDTVGVPAAPLLTAHGQYPGALAACTEWDQVILHDMVAAASGPSTAPNGTLGGLSQATLASLVYRQVLGHHALAWHTAQARPWYFLKEIASGGDDSTMDVIYPSSPLLLSYAPTLLASLLIPIMEASSPPAYDKAWVAHDLGKFPVADRRWSGQEDMPVEETANLMHMVAAIGYLNASNLDLFRPYYDLVTGFSRWAAFLTESLPYPPRQGTTDDFLPSTANGTNLVAKGCAGLGAWGYIQWVYGNETGAVASWTDAGFCGAALVDNGWYTPSDSSKPGHFTWSYQLQHAETSSFCIYNLLYMRLLRQDTLLPNQTQYFSQLAQYYGFGEGIAEVYGVPLVNGSDGMKLDWNTFLATALYEPSVGPYPSVPSPGVLASSIFAAMLAGANKTNLRAPMTDFYSAKDATYGGKYRGRPVMGGVWAPVALAKLTALPPMAHEVPMAQAFAAGQAQYYKNKNTGE